MLLCLNVMFKNQVSPEVFLVFAFLLVQESLFEGRYYSNQRLLCRVMSSDSSIAKSILSPSLNGFKINPPLCSYRGRLCYSTILLAFCLCSLKFQINVRYRIGKYSIKMTLYYFRRNKATKLSWPTSVILNVG